MASRINKRVEQVAKECGLFVAGYSPGDGVVRYRFFRVETDYFSDNGIYTALGVHDALIFCKGFRLGRNFPIPAMIFESGTSGD